MHQLNTMAKSKKCTVIYCKFCDDILKDDIIKKSGETFCSQSCCGAWLKTRQTPMDKSITILKGIIQSLKAHTTDIKMTCKSNYIKVKSFWEEIPAMNPTKKSINEQVKMYAYIYNGNKQKFEEAFQKWKKLTQDEIDGMLFDGKQMSLTHVSDSGEASERLTGEESLRVYSIRVKLQMEYFTLMAEQTF